MIRLGKFFGRLGLVATLAILIVWPAFSQSVNEEFLVLIDVGHDAAKPGPQSASGEVEFDYNKIFARNLFDKFVQEGYGVVMYTAPDNTSLVTRRKHHEGLSNHLVLI